MTKEERFIVTVFQMASELGDPEHEIPAEEIGATLGITKKKSILNLYKMCAQANFCKRTREDEIYLTPEGVNLAQTLLGSHGGSR